MNDAALTSGGECTVGELDDRAAFFADELSAAMGRHRWLIEQTIVLAAAQIARNEACHRAMVFARAAVLSLVSDVALAECAAELPSRSEVAQQLLPRLPGYPQK